MKPGRKSCCVPFCRRTIAEEKAVGFSEWMCGKHFAMATKRARKLHRARVRAWDRISVKEWWTLKPGSEERLRVVDAFYAQKRSWEIIKRMVIGQLEF